MNSTSIGLNLQDTKADKRIKDRQNHREITVFERQLCALQTLSVHSTF